MGMVVFLLRVVAIVLIEYFQGKYYILKPFFFLNSFDGHLPKNQHKEGGIGETRHCTESIYWKSIVDVYDPSRF